MTLELKTEIIETTLNAIHEVSRIEKKPELSHMLSDFELDSIDIIEVIMNIENRTGIRIPDEFLPYEKFGEKDKDGMSIPMFIDSIIDAIDKLNIEK